MANNRHILEDLFKAVMQLLNQIEDQSENEEAATRAIKACLLDYRAEHEAWMNRVFKSP